MARPRLPEAPPTKRHEYPFRVPEALWQAFVRECERQDRPASRVLQRLVKEFVGAAPGAR